MNSVAVVIPIHKEFIQFSELEKISLSRSIEVLSCHQFIFLVSDKLDNKGLIEYLKKTKLKKITFQKTNCKNFINIESYSRLLISSTFYKYFKKYEFVLICQLDVYVFSDMLNYWINKKNIHYIGAPWFNCANGEWTQDFMGVGNGGFSLRNVKYFIDFLTRIKIIFAIKEIYSKYKIFENLSYKKLLLRLNFYFKIKAFWELDKLFLPNYIPEDQYFGLYLSSIFSDFMLADFENSYKFSFETNPSYLFELNKFQLPFGCHAWKKYDSEFWASYIPAKI
jgi:hypothetical protein